MFNLATLYRLQGQYTEAELLYRRALSIQEKVSGRENLLAITCIKGLAVLHHLRGKYAQAEQFFQQAIDLSEKIEYVGEADIIRSLADLYLTQGKYAEAEQLYQRALSIHEKTYGPDQPGIAVYLHSIGMFFYKKGKYKANSQRQNHSSSVPWQSMRILWERSILR